MEDTVEAAYLFAIAEKLPTHSSLATAERHELATKISLGDFAEAFSDPQEYASCLRTAAEEQGWELSVDRLLGYCQDFKQQLWTLMDRNPAEMAEFFYDAAADMSDPDVEKRLAWYWAAQMTADERPIDMEEGLALVASKRND